jgi:hypothetical protein
MCNKKKLHRGHREDTEVTEKNFPEINSGQVLGIRSRSGGFKLDTCRNDKNHKGITG